MQNKKWIRFVESLIILPVMATSGPVAPATKVPTALSTNPPIVSSQKLNIEAFGSIALNQVIAPKAIESKDESVEADALARNARAAAIDTYFKDHDMPLEGMGMKMVIESEKNDLDWRLLAAISIRESTGGRQECVKVPNNAFGWGSCKIGFKSNEEAIETVARNLGGNNPKTAKHYDNKTTLEILHTYNPPSVVPLYAEQVMSIMDKIGDKDLGSTDSDTSA